MGILSILIIFVLSAPAAYAYPENPPFEQTQFADDFGVFRSWQNCWWRMFDPYVYLLCQPNGQVYLLYPDGRVELATEADLAKFFSTDGRRIRGLWPPPVPRRFPRPSIARLSPAPGDGFRLSDVYCGKFTRFDGSGFPRFTLPSGAGVFSFDEFGNRIPGDFRPFDPCDRDRDSDGGSGGVDFGDREDTDNHAMWRFARDGTGTTRLAREGGRFQGSPMHPIFYKPVIGRCQNIHDSIDGGIFGPIPCTSYPGVFGPRVGFTRRTQ